MIISLFIEKIASFYEFLCYDYLMEKSESPNKKSSLKQKFQKTRSKLLGAYYGHPIQDMKLICITGSTGKLTVAHFVHEILRAAGQHVAILASDSEISAGTLHKFFADAWKSGANYVVVTAQAESLEKNAFFDLPICVAAITNYVDSSLSTPPAKEFSKSEAILFKMSPENIVLNSDDLYYSDFSKFQGKKSTLTYGRDSSSTIRINSSKLYKRGVEANFSLGSSFFTVASFLTGEPIISYMACAAAIATALSISTNTIIDGIANYSEDSSIKP